MDARHDQVRDLERDPRFCLHTVTVDPYLGDGDVKLWAEARNLRDEDFHARFADGLFEESGFDLRGEVFDPFYVADITGASSIELGQPAGDHHLEAERGRACRPKDLT